MAKKIDIKLWMDRNSAPMNGYTGAKKENGDDYQGIFYRFDGGNVGDGAPGDVRVSKIYDATDVRITRRGRWQKDFIFKGIRITRRDGDIGPTELETNRIIITSLAQTMGIFEYDVILTDIVNGGEDIYCHPRVVNDWNLLMTYAEVIDAANPWNGQPLTLYDDGTYRE